MKKLSTKLIAGLIAILGIFTIATAPALISSSTYAEDAICQQSTIPQSVKDAYGCGNAGSSDDFSNTLQGILNGIIAVLGIVAAIFIVTGGVWYMTSQGDPGKTKKAKDTILYAAIGLIICALSFAIVNFVIINILKGQNSSSPDYVKAQCQEAGKLYNSNTNSCE